MGFVDNIIAKCKYTVPGKLYHNIEFVLVVKHVCYWFYYPIAKLLAKGIWHHLYCVFQPVDYYFEFHFLQCTCFWYWFIPGIATVCVPDFDWFISDIATVFGYLVVSRPFLNLAHPRHLNSSHSERLEVCSYLQLSVNNKCKLHIKLE